MRNLKHSVYKFFDLQEVKESDVRVYNDVDTKLLSVYGEGLKETYDYMWLSLVTIYRISSVSVVETMYRRTVRYPRWSE